MLPSYDDAYANWKNAGLLSVGGIPRRTTVCATVNPLGGWKDDFTNIKNAINGCPAGEVVQLGAGAFTVRTADLPQRESLKEPQRLTVRDTAKGDIARLYAYYALLSHDAAHPSVTALERHFSGLQRPPDADRCAAVQAGGANGDTGHGVRRASWRSARC